MPIVLLSLFFGESKVLKVVFKTLHYNDLVLFLHVCVKCFILRLELFIREILKICTLGSYYWPCNQASMLCRSEWFCDGSIQAEHILPFFLSFLVEIG